MQWTHQPAKLLSEKKFARILGGFVSDVKFNVFFIFSNVDISPINDNFFACPSFAFCID